MTGPAIPEVSREDLWAQLATTSCAPALVETLGRDFYVGGHLPGALNITCATVDAAAAVLLPDRERAVVVYGSADRQPPLAVARRLLELGYRDVRLYAGGKEEWAGSGLPLAYPPSDT